MDTIALTDSKPVVQWAIDKRMERNNRGGELRCGMAIEKISTKGGARPGAGRKKGAPNKRTAETQAKALAAGISPLDYMLSLLHSKPPRGATALQKAAHTALRFEAAKAAAPYVHARLANTTVTGKDGGPLQVVIQSTDADL